MPAPTQRIDALLSRFGYCSRHQARKFVRDVTVTVDGRAVTDPAEKAAAAAVLVDGEPLDHPNGIFVMLHKPAGLVCSHDGGDGPSIYSLLPPQWMSRNPLPATVGRLDKDTTGIILITDQTQLIHRLTSPKSRIDKVYEVTVDRPLDGSIAKAFGAGTLQLHGEPRPCLPARLETTGERTCTVTLQEGKYHQVKRMFAACGYRVEKLHRTAFGRYLLGDLAESRYADLPLPAVGGVGDPGGAAQ